MGLLYSKMKVFHYKEKLDSLPATVKATMAPLHVRIKPTNRCNHNCWYCAYRVGHLQLGQDMQLRDFIPREKMLQIIEDLVQMKVKAVTFSGGGEPLCYPYMEETLKRLITTPIAFATLTNGSLLSGRVAELFARHGTWIRISIDGWDAKSYSAYRGVGPDEFGKVMRNIRNFKRLKGPCYLGISFIIDKKNHAHIHTFLQRLKDMGVDSVKVSPCIVSNDSAANHRYHAPIFKRVKNEIHRSIARLQGRGFEIFDSYHGLNLTFAKDYSWCPFIQILPVIGADCNVYTCYDKAYNLKEGLLGSIRTRRFKDFWQHDRKKFFKVDPRRHCNHHCVADEKNRIIHEYLNVDKDHLGFV